MAHIGDSLGLPVPEGTAPPDIVSKKGLAGIFGVHPSRITQMIAKGLPLEPNGRVSVTKARAWIADNVDPDRRKILRDNDRPAYGSGNAQRAELDRIRTERARLDLDKARGALVDRKAAESAIFSRARAERDAHLAWSVRVAPILAARFGLDPTAVVGVLDGEMRRHLQELADKPLAELIRGP